jgi:Zn-dependent protease with chaperone function
LGIERPDVYVVQETVFNAFASKLAGRKIIVLYSGAIDSILRNGDDDDLAFLLGHEFGHIAAGHLSLIHRAQRLGAWFIWVGLWHRRRMELTCDRIGLELVGDRDRALRALAHMTVGSTLASELDVDVALEQLAEHEHEFFARYRVFYALYPSNLHRLRQLRQAAVAAPAFSAEQGEFAPQLA